MPPSAAVAAMALLCRSRTSASTICFASATEASRYRMEFILQRFDRGGGS
jgi:hypothetical protein